MRIAVESHNQHSIDVYITILQRNYIRDCLTGWEERRDPNSCKLWIAIFTHPSDTSLSYSIRSIFIEGVSFGSKEYWIWRVSPGVNRETAGLHVSGRESKMVICCLPRISVISCECTSNRILKGDCAFSARTPPVQWLLWSLGWKEFISPTTVQYSWNPNCSYRIPRTLSTLQK